MKLPSLTSLLKKSGETFKRFSIALCFSFLGAGLGIYLIHSSSSMSPSSQIYFNMLMSTYLGMLLSISITVGMERKYFTRNSKILIHLTSIAFAILFYFSLPDEFVLTSTVRFFLFVLSLHLLIAFIPFIQVKELNGFWQYNKSLFLRILSSALYSGVLFVGLAIAIAAVQNLFKVDLDEKIYAYLWVFIVGVFNTWFCLSGFPAKLEDLDLETDYPKGLKLFTQYVLLPLISIYLLILYAYLFKIIIQAQWPVGYVSILVLCFSIAGIFSLLLIYPVRNDEGNKWILLYSRLFYFALYPQLILLFLAIERRIQEYGITEQRYFVLLIAVWLLFISSYFLLSKTKNIKLIPISLCLIAFGSSFGPWGAFSVSKRSQQKHLLELLEKNKFLKDGKFVKSSHKISYDDHEEIVSVSHYLLNVHGVESLQAFFKQNLDEVITRKSSELYSYERENKLDSLLDIKYENSVAPANVFEFYRDLNEAKQVSGFDYVVDDFTAYASQDSTIGNYKLGNNDYEICFIPMQNKLLLFPKKNPNSSISFDMNACVRLLKSKKMAEQNEMPMEAMIFEAGNKEIDLRLLVNSLQGTYEKEVALITHLKVSLLFRFKEKIGNSSTPVQ